jgi:hypothetical protein
VPVTSVRSENVYVYSQSLLWIGYGISLFLGSVFVTMGMVALIHNGASYSDIFSTVLRVTGLTTVDKVILPEDMNGRDPLPTYLAHAMVTFRDEPLAGDNSYTHVAEPGEVSNDREK